MLDLSHLTIYVRSVVVVNDKTHKRLKEEQNKTSRKSAKVVETSFLEKKWCHNTNYKLYINRFLKRITSFLILGSEPKKKGYCLNNQLESRMMIRILKMSIWIVQVVAYRIWHDYTKIEWIRKRKKENKKRKRN